MTTEIHSKEFFLFEEMKQGKEYAFDFFFNYYYPGLCVFARKIGSISEEDCKNLVQDVFLKFWNDREKIIIQSSVRAYLFVSVKNKCLDFFKKTGRDGYSHLSELDAVDLAGDSFETYVLAELETLFRSGLEKLPGRCREVFELSRFEGLKNREIAVKLDISEKTVENQMTKALRILKIELKDYLPLLILFESYNFINQLFSIL